jgi:hypothetical protein
MTTPPVPKTPAPPEMTVRPVRRGDLDAVIALDAEETGTPKRDYWRSLFRRYGSEAAERQFLVAVAGDQLMGFVIGEVRDWEFGSPACGWVFAINVSRKHRLGGAGATLLQAICAGFRKAGTRTVRTILARDNTLILSFFRSQGMVAGPFIPLEMSLDD